MVDRLALTLAVNREDLNIVSTNLLSPEKVLENSEFFYLLQVATSKGVISGPITLQLQDDTRLDASSAELVREPF